MLNYLHDIRNKITIVNNYTALLSRKYNDEEINVITANMIRINDLLNEAYKEFKLLPELEQNTIKNDEITLKDFENKLDLIIDSISLGFPLSINNLISSTQINGAAKIVFNMQTLMQVLENAFDNSLKANSSKLSVRLSIQETNCIVELIDNGSGISPLATAVKDSSTIPHGLGKKFMSESMKSLNGSVEWTPRMDGSGMIVRLYFPIIRS